MSTDVKNLHYICKSLGSDELILIYLTLEMQGAFKAQPDLKKIIKTYLVRALLREGII